jgi:3-oxoacyl-[acyl-carrier protein] reductase
LDLGLAGRSAVVVGASAGVGRAAALVLAQEGARVLLVARRADLLEATAAQARELGGEAAVLAADVLQAQAGERIVAHALDVLGGLDIVVNTVGPFPRGASHPALGDDDSWRAAFETLLLPTVRVCRAALPVMQAAGRGAIVNIAANSARHFSASTAQYGAMKAALTHITKNWAREAAPHGVRVNAILPGWIRTETLVQSMQAAAAKSGKAIAEIERDMMDAHGSAFWSRRMGEPREYADLIAFLASERASYLNGALIAIDGGSPTY